LAALSQEYQRDEEAKCNPDDVLLQASSPCGSSLGRGSGLDEEFHLDPGQLDHVVVVQRVSLGVERLAIHYGEARPFDVRDEKTLRPARDDGHLHPGLAERRKRLGQVELLAGVAPESSCRAADFCGAPTGLADTGGMVVAGPWPATVSPMAFAATGAAACAGAGAGAAGAGMGLIAPGRSTIVFSKSAALATPAASRSHT